LDPLQLVGDRHRMGRGEHPQAPALQTATTSSGLPTPPPSGASCSGSPQPTSWLKAVGSAVIDSVWRAAAAPSRRGPTMFATHALGGPNAGITWHVHADGPIRTSDAAQDLTDC
jgi:hypothetical protein